MYTPHTARDIEAMLRVVGVASLDELVRVPDALALRAPLDVTPQLSEIEIAARFAVSPSARPPAATPRSSAPARTGTTFRRSSARSRCAASS
jgi:hypothetical protein